MMTARDSVGGGVVHRAWRSVPMSTGHVGLQRGITPARSRSLRACSAVQSLRRFPIRRPLRRIQPHAATSSNQRSRCRRSASAGGPPDYLTASDRDIVAGRTWTERTGRAGRLDGRLRSAPHPSVPRATLRGMYRRRRPRRPADPSRRYWLLDRNTCQQRRARGPSTPGSCRGSRRGGGPPPAAAAVEAFRSSRRPATDASRIGGHELDPSRYTVRLPDR